MPDLALAVEVRQCTLTSGAHGWGPGVCTEIGRSALAVGGRSLRLPGEEGNEGAEGAEGVDGEEGEGRVEGGEEGEEG